MDEHGRASNCGFKLLERLLGLGKSHKIGRLTHQGGQGLGYVREVLNVFAVEAAQTVEATDVRGVPWHRELVDCLNAFWVDGDSLRADYVS